MDLSCEEIELDYEVSDSDHEQNNELSENLIVKAALSSSAIRKPVSDSSFFATSTKDKSQSKICDLSIMTNMNNAALFTTHELSNPTDAPNLEGDSVTLPTKSNSSLSTQTLVRNRPSLFSEIDRRQTTGRNDWHCQSSVFNEQRKQSLNEKSADVLPIRKHLPHLVRPPTEVSRVKCEHPSNVHKSTVGSLPFRKWTKMCESASQFKADVKPTHILSSKVVSSLSSAATSTAFATSDNASKESMNVPKPKTVSKKGDFASFKGNEIPNHRPIVDNICDPRTHTSVLKAEINTKQLSAQTCCQPSIKDSNKISTNVERICVKNTVRKTVNKNTTDKTVNKKQEDKTMNTKNGNSSAKKVSVSSNLVSRKRLLKRLTSKRVSTRTSKTNFNVKSFEEASCFSNVNDKKSGKVPAYTICSKIKPGPLSKRCKYKKSVSNLNLSQESFCSDIVFSFSDVAFQKLDSDAFKATGNCNILDRVTGDTVPDSRSTVVSNKKFKSKNSPNVFISATVKNTALEDTIHKTAFCKDRVKNEFCKSGAVRVSGSLLQSSIPDSAKKKCKKTRAESAVDPKPKGSLQVILSGTRVNNEISQESVTTSVNDCGNNKIDNKDIAELRSNSDKASLGNNSLDDKLSLASEQRICTEAKGLSLESTDEIVRKFPDLFKLLDNDFSESYITCTNRNEAKILNLFRIPVNRSNEAVSIHPSANNNTSGTTTLPSNGNADLFHGHLGAKVSQNLGVSHCVSHQTSFMAVTNAILAENYNDPYNFVPNVLRRKELPSILPHSYQICDCKLYFQFTTRMDIFFPKDLILLSNLQSVMLDENRSCVSIGSVPVYLFYLADDICQPFMRVVPYFTVSEIDDYHILKVQNKGLQLIINTDDIRRVQIPNGGLVLVLENEVSVFLVYGYLPCHVDPSQFWPAYPKPKISFSSFGMNSDEHLNSKPFKFVRVSNAQYVADVRVLSAILRHQMWLDRIKNSSYFYCKPIYQPVVRLDTKLCRDFTQIERQYMVNVQVDGSVDYNRHFAVSELTEHCKTFDPFAQSEVTEISTADSSLQDGNKSNEANPRSASYVSPVHASEGAGKSVRRIGDILTFEKLVSRTNSDTSTLTSLACLPALTSKTHAESDATYCKDHQMYSKPGPKSKKKQIGLHSNRDMISSCMSSSEVLPSVEKIESETCSNLNSPEAKPHMTLEQVDKKLSPVEVFSRPHDKTIHQRRVNAHADIYEPVMDQNGVCASRMVQGFNPVLVSKQEKKVRTASRKVVSLTLERHVCLVCDTVVNDSGNFKMHINSKRHLDCTSVQLRAISDMLYSTKGHHLTSLDVEEASKDMEIVNEEVEEIENEVPSTDENKVKETPSKVPSLPLEQRCGSSDTLVSAVEVASHPFDERSHPECSVAGDQLSANDSALFKALDSDVSKAAAKEKADRGHYTARSFSQEMSKYSSIGEGVTSFFENPKEAVATCSSLPQSIKVRLGPVPCKPGQANPFCVLPMARKDFNRAVTNRSVVLTPYAGTFADSYATSRSAGVRHRLLSGGRGYSRGFRGVGRGVPAGYMRGLGGGILGRLSSRGYSQSRNISYRLAPASKSVRSLKKRNSSGTDHRSFSTCLTPSTDISSDSGIGLTMRLSNRLGTSSRAHQPIKTYDFERPPPSPYMPHPLVSQPGDLCDEGVNIAAGSKTLVNDPLAEIERLRLQRQNTVVGKHVKTLYNYKSSDSSTIFDLDSRTTELKASHHAKYGENSKAKPLSTYVDLDKPSANFVGYYDASTGTYRMLDTFQLKGSSAGDKDAKCDEVAAISTRMADDYDDSYSCMLSAVINMISCKSEDLPQAISGGQVGLVPSDSRSEIADNVGVSDELVTGNTPSSSVPAGSFGIVSPRVSDEFLSDVAPISFRPNSDFNNIYSMHACSNKVSNTTAVTPGGDASSCYPDYSSNEQCICATNDIVGNCSSAEPDAKSDVTRSSKISNDCISHSSSRSRTCLELRSSGVEQPLLSKVSSPPPVTQLPNVPLNESFITDVNNFDMDAFIQNLVDSQLPPVSSTPFEMSGPLKSPIPIVSESDVSNPSVSRYCGAIFDRAETSKKDEPDHVRFDVSFEDLSDFSVQKFPTSMNSTKNHDNGLNLLPNSRASTSKDAAIISSDCLTEFLAVTPNKCEQFLNGVGITVVKNMTHRGSANSDGTQADRPPANIDLTESDYPRANSDVTEHSNQRASSDMTEPDNPDANSDVTEPDNPRANSNEIFSDYQHANSDVTVRDIPHVNTDVTGPNVPHENYNVTEPNVPHENYNVTEPNVPHENYNVTEPNVPHENYNVTEPNILHVNSNVTGPNPSLVKFDVTPSNNAAVVSDGTDPHGLQKCTVGLTSLSRSENEQAAIQMLKSNTLEIPYFEAFSSCIMSSCGVAEGEMKEIYPHSDSGIIELLGDSSQQIENSVSKCEYSESAGDVSYFSKSVQDNLVQNWDTNGHYESKNFCKDDDSDTSMHLLLSSDESMEADIIDTDKILTASEDLNVPKSDDMCYDTITDTKCIEKSYNSGEVVEENALNCECEDSVYDKLRSLDVSTDSSSSSSSVSSSSSSSSSSTSSSESSSESHDNDEDLKKENSLINSNANSYLPDSNVEKFEGNEFIKKTDIEIERVKEVSCDETKKSSISNDQASAIDYLVPNLSLNERKDEDTVELFSDLYLTESSEESDNGEPCEIFHLDDIESPDEEPVQCSEVTKRLSEQESQSVDKKVRELSSSDSKQLSAFCAPNHSEALLEEDLFLSSRSAESTEPSPYKAIVSECSEISPNSLERSHSLMFPTVINNSGKEISKDIENERRSAAISPTNNVIDCSHIVSNGSKLHLTEDVIPVGSRQTVDSEHLVCRNYLEFAKFPRQSIVSGPVGEKLTDNSCETKHLRCRDQQRSPLLNLSCSPFESDKPQFTSSPRRLSGQYSEPALSKNMDLDAQHHFVPEANLCPSEVSNAPSASISNCALPCSQLNTMVVASNRIGDIAPTRPSLFKSAVHMFTSEQHSIKNSCSGLEVVAGQDLRSDKQQPLKKTSDVSNAAISVKELCESCVHSGRMNASHALKSENDVEYWCQPIDKWQKPCLEGVDIATHSKENKMCVSFPDNVPMKDTHSVVDVSSCLDLTGFNHEKHVKSTCEDFEKVVNVKSLHLNEADDHAEECLDLSFCVREDEFESLFDENEIKSDKLLKTVQTVTSKDKSSLSSRSNAGGIENKVNSDIPEQTNVNVNKRVQKSSRWDASCKSGSHSKLSDRNLPHTSQAMAHLSFTRYGCESEAERYSTRDSESYGICEQASTTVQRHSSVGALLTDGDEEFRQLSADSDRLKKQNQDSKHPRFLIPHEKFEPRNAQENISAKNSCGTSVKERLWMKENASDCSGLLGENKDSKKSVASKKEFNPTEASTGLSRTTQNKLLHRTKGTSSLTRPESVRHDQFGSPIKSSADGRGSSVTFAKPMADDSSVLRPSASQFGLNLFSGDRIQENARRNTVRQRPSVYSRLSYNIKDLKLLERVLPISSRISNEICQESDVDTASGCSSVKNVEQQEKLKSCCLEKFNENFKVSTSKLIHSTTDSSHCLGASHMKPSESSSKFSEQAPDETIEVINTNIPSCLQVQHQESKSIFNARSIFEQNLSLLTNSKRGAKNSLLDDTVLALEEITSKRQKLSFIPSTPDLPTHCVIENYSNDVNKKGQSTYLDVQKASECSTSPKTNSAFKRLDKFYTPTDDCLPGIGRGLSSKNHIRSPAERKSSSNKFCKRETNLDNFGSEVFRYSLKANSLRNIDFRESFNASCAPTGLSQNTNEHRVKCAKATRTDGRITKRLLPSFSWDNRSATSSTELQNRNLSYSGQTETQISSFQKSIADCIQQNPQVAQSSFHSKAIFDVNTVPENRFVQTNLPSVHHSNSNFVPEYRTTFTYEVDTSNQRAVSGDPGRSLADSKPPDITSNENFDYGGTCLIDEYYSQEFDRMWDDELLKKEFGVQF